MKVNLIGKYKWYIFGAIAVVLMLSIGLSFCAWDSNTIAKSFNGTTADAKVQSYTLAQDFGVKGEAEVGDTVYFGSYYQQANQTTKTTLEWRIVDIRTENNREILYLLTEMAVASGPFYGKACYYNTEQVMQYTKDFVGSQCYSDSTVRAWLNSDQFGAARSDGGVGFANPPAGNLKVFNGFYTEAFNDAEKGAIIPRTIPGMYGYSLRYDNNTSKHWYADLPNQRVWISSVTELFGSYDGGTDSPMDRQFSYYSDISISKTAFPTNFNNLVDGKVIANFGYDDLPATDYNLGLSSHPMYNGSCYLLYRTPSPTSSTSALGNRPSDTLADHSVGEVGYSVRPGICLVK